ncbi:MGMT family protein [Aureibacillus halotolerans]|uniref:Methylated-DNA-protein-cysteine methyltransferase-like protein n=1 Tax=Aureibacillus halotolerans TaxID=1508390 RepID=A0A4R6U8D5_9BACI|nr:MGMT family protein [Aureibacillus halotolerans]TDQ40875.1 methylated-DNA-protein-cysteine methyltransferase-like protein [Aureibacillus halotolerans]
MTPFTSRVVDLMKAIPEGRVMTYGQIAAAAGSPRGARQVVRILHSMSRKHQLPWQRVVNARGEIAIRDPEGSLTQQELLEEEGVELSIDGTIDLERYRHIPE